MYYSSGGYVDLVHKLAEDNMDRAMSGVKLFLNTMYWEK